MTEKMVGLPLQNNKRKTGLVGVCRVLLGIPSIHFIYNKMNSFCIQFNDEISFNTERSMALLCSESCLSFYHA